MVAALILGAVVAGCQSTPSGEPSDAAEYMGNASPAASPDVTVEPAGEVTSSPAVTSLATDGALIAVRSAGTLTVGTLDEIVSGAGRSFALDDSCGAVSASPGVFAAGCGDTIRMFTPGGETETPAEANATAVAVTSAGDVLAASDADRTVHVYRDGKVADSFTAARETDLLVAVPRGDAGDSTDQAVRVNRFDTTVQNLDIANGRQGGTLRAGLGIGTIATGPGGLVLASDATGSQLLVYLVDNVIRLQMSAPVASNPWAVAWDDAHRLAWTASTALNTAEGYDLSKGVPSRRASFPTVRDAQSMISLNDGTLVLASAAGDGIQVVSPSTIEGALS
ncbi:hypothetical protein CAPI_05545 [Corynebacterium capitovis DSM 44611]|nr:hypothetical protein CAPI_05545 [Corynebacterium capitovis DSM 44611]